MPHPHKHTHSYKQTNTHIFRHTGTHKKAWLCSAEEFLELYGKHGRLARWIKWRVCDVGEAKDGLENELWRRWSNGRVGEWAVTLVKQSSFSNLSVTSPMSQLFLQPFRRFTYVRAHSPTLPFSNPSFASPTSQALHLIHLASRPWSLSLQDG